jgi:hypothetical protein
LISGWLGDVVAQGAVLRYQRRNDDQHFVILLNLGNAQEEAMSVPGQVVVSTCLDRTEQINGTVSLRPYEGLIIKATM